MTLIIAVVVGFACGYLMGLRRKAFAVFLAVWLIVLAFQTFVVLAPEHAPPPAAWEYVPVQVVILAVGFAGIWIGEKVHSRFLGRPTPAN